MFLLGIMVCVCARALVRACELRACANLLALLTVLTLLLHFISIVVAEVLIVDVSSVIIVLSLLLMM